MKMNIYWCSDCAGHEKDPAKIEPCSTSVRSGVYVLNVEHGCDFY